jgi:hypothetical protein
MFSIWLTVSGESMGGKGRVRVRVRVRVRMEGAV